MEIKVKHATVLWVVGWIVIIWLAIMALSGCKNDSRASVTISDPAISPSITCEYWVSGTKKIGCEPKKDDNFGFVTVEVKTDSSPTFLKANGVVRIVVSGSYLFGVNKKHDIMEFELIYDNRVVSFCSVFTGDRDRR